MTQIPPRLPLRLLNLTLPSADDLWEAETCDKWFERLKQKSNLGCDPEDFALEEKSRLPIQKAVQRLWTELRSPAPIIELGTTALIQVLIRRIWDTIWYLDDPIKFPLQDHGPNHDQLQSESQDPPIRYLATIPKFTKWRNRTCDSLDVLHWEAMSVSARASGLEGSVFLQLHLARLMILTPVRELLGHMLACRRSPAASNGLLLPHDLYDVPISAQQYRKTILIWAHKDRFKARLAVIHAGAIFWHVRRYSSDCFTQPFAVYIAAITLWAYGTFSRERLAPSPLAPPPQAAAQTCGNTTNTSHHNLSEDCTTGVFPIPSLHDQVQDDTIEGPSTQSLDSRPRFLAARTSMVRQTDNHNDRPSPADSTAHSTTSTTNQSTKKSSYHRRMPSQIQLDRPIDDELVQHFIRSGPEDGMILLLEGVDDLCSVDGNGPERVLREGILILDGLDEVWSIAEVYRMGLQGVLDDAAEQSQSQQTLEDKTAFHAHVHGRVDT